MFKSIDLKKVALLLLLLFLGTAAASCFIFFAQYGNDFNAETLFSDNIKNGTKVDVEKTEALQGLERIAAETTSEDIRIIPSESGDVKVHLYGTYLASDKSVKPTLVVERSGDSLKIKVDWNRHTMLLRFQDNLKLDVYIPTQYAAQLEVQSTSGEIAAEGFTLNSFKAKATSGNLEVNRMNAGTAEIATTSGNTKLSGTYDRFSYQSTSGSLTATDFVSRTSTLESTSGEIEVTGKPGDLKANSSSGKVNLEYEEYNNRVEVTTTSGEVGIRLPENAGFSLDFSSNSGNAECSFPITTSDNPDGNRLKGTVGSGAGSILVRTTSGEFSIGK